MLVRNILLISAFLAISIGHTTELTIRKIEVKGNTFTKAERILGFAKEISEGQIRDSLELEENAGRIKERLEITLWFDSVGVSLASNEKDARSVDVIIEVKEGFLYLLWGGDLYAAIGKANFDRNGSMALLELGTNRQRLSAKANFTCTNFYGVAAVGDTERTILQNDLSYLSVKYAGLWLGMGLYSAHDITTEISVDNYFLLSDNFERIDRYSDLGVRMAVDKRSDLFSSYKGYFALGRATWQTKQGNIAADVDLRKYLAACSRKSKLAFRIKGLGIAGENVSGYNLVSLDGIDGIRIPGRKEMIGRFGLLGQVEFRLQCCQLDLFRLGQCLVEPAFFADIGRTSQNLRELINTNSVLYGAGLGLRCWFGSPILMPLRIEAGLNKNGDPILLFDLVSPF